MICIGFSSHRCSQCTLIRYVSDRGRLMVNIYGTTLCPALLHRPRLRNIIIRPLRVSPFPFVCRAMRRLDHKKTKWWLDFLVSIHLSVWEEDFRFRVARGFPAIGRLDGDFMGAVGLLTL